MQCFVTYVCLAVMLNCIKIYDWRNRFIYQVFKSGYLLVAYCISDFEKKWSTKIHKVWLTLNFDIETFETYITWSFFSQSSPIYIIELPRSFFKKIESFFRHPNVFLAGGFFWTLHRFTTRNYTHARYTLYILCSLCT